MSIGLTSLAQKYGDQTETFILNEAELRECFDVSGETKSAVAVPLAGKEGLMGIIYLEHVRENYFQPVFQNLCLM